MIAALFALPIVRYALGALAALAPLMAALWWLRSDAASDAVNKVAVEAAQKQEETRHEGDAAARDAERSGAGSLLDAGRF